MSAESNQADLFARVDFPLYSISMVGTLNKTQFPPISKQFSYFRYLLDTCWWLVVVERPILELKMGLKYSKLQTMGKILLERASQGDNNQEL